MSLRVLVTRPHAQASSTMAAMVAEGHQVLAMPCLEIVPVSSISAQGKTNQYLAMNLDAYAHVVVVSTNAAASFLPLIENYWPQWPVAQTFWGMGSTTCGLLQAAQLPSVQRSPLADTSEALLQSLLPKVAIGDKVLIVRGLGGRETLATALREQGAVVDYAQCYQRQAPQLTVADRLQVEAFAPQVVVLQSGETLLNFDAGLGDLVDRAGNTTRLLVPSQRVLVMAQQLGYRQCLLSAGASDQAICHTLNQLNSQ
ncbi:MAG: uroporphyrinogen-III synthase [Gammaproteobacteria bacterium]|jgi:uroporphyrinogen-III synthase|nr:uroporphyrinogen-III synthase [Gammaproteobacteria bacterium]